MSGVLRRLPEECVGRRGLHHRGFVEGPSLVGHIKLLVLLSVDMDIDEVLS